MTSETFLRRLWSLTFLLELEDLRELCSMPSWSLGLWWPWSQILTVGVACEGASQDWSCARTSEGSTKGWCRIGWGKSLTPMGSSVAVAALARAVSAVSWEEWSWGSQECAVLWSSEGHGPCEGGGRCWRDVEHSVPWKYCAWRRGHPYNVMGLGYEAALGGCPTLVEGTPTSSVLDVSAIGESWRGGGTSRKPLWWGDIWCSHRAHACHSDRRLGVDTWWARFGPTVSDIHQSHSAEKTSKRASGALRGVRRSKKPVASRPVQVSTLHLQLRVYGHRWSRTKTPLASLRKRAADGFRKKSHVRLGQKRFQNLLKKRNYWRIEGAVRWATLSTAQW